MTDDFDVVSWEPDRINESARFQIAGRIQYNIHGRMVIVAGPTHRSAIANSHNTIASERLQDLLAQTLFLIVD